MKANNYIAKLIYNHGEIETVTITACSWDQFWTEMALWKSRKLPEKDTKELVEINIHKEE